MQGFLIPTPPRVPGKDFQKRERIGNTGRDVDNLNVIHRDGKSIQAGFSQHHTLGTPTVGQAVYTFNSLFCRINFLNAFRVKLPPAADKIERVAGLLRFCCTGRLPGEAFHEKLLQ